MKNAFSLKPYLRSKGDSTCWAFEVKPYRSVKKVAVVARVLSMYPDLKVSRVYTVKSIKRNLVVLETDRTPPWVKQ